MREQAPLVDVDMDVPLSATFQTAANCAEVAEQMGKIDSKNKVNKMSSLTTIVTLYSIGKHLFKLPEVLKNEPHETST